MISAVPRYKFVLARSSDKATITPVSAASTRGLNLYFNRPGQLSITTPIDSDVAMKAGELNTCLIASATFFSDQGEVVDSREVWSGPVFNINDACPEDTTSLTALGWLQELESRFLDGMAIYPAWVGGRIGLDLLSLANSKIDSIGRQQPTHVVAGTYTDTQVRTRTYQRGQNIGAALRELSEVEDGYDIYLESSGRTLSFKTPTDFADRTHVRFGYNREPFNLASIQRQTDAGKTRNRIVGQGASGPPVSGDDPDSIGLLGIMMEDYISISDAVSTDILSAYVGGELAFSSFPEQVFTIKPIAPVLGRSVPVFGRDFDLGEQVYVSVNRGRLQLDNQAMRVFGVGLSFDSNGNQQVDSIDVGFSG